VPVCNAGKSYMEGGQFLNKFSSYIETSGSCPVRMKIFSAFKRIAQIGNEHSNPKMSPANKMHQIKSNQLMFVNYLSGDTLQLSSCLSFRKPKSGIKFTMEIYLKANYT
jgi:hypothetical protein